MDGEKYYILKITEGTRVVAEAPLIIYDKEATMRNFLEALPAVIQQATPALVGMLQMACAEVEPPGELAGIDINGNHTGLVLTDQLPPSNGPNRAERRHPGF